MSLTGKPSVDGVLLPYMAYEAPCSCEWDGSESITIELDDGTEEIIERVWRLQGTGAWNALSETDLAQLKTLLAGVFEFTPRTQRSGDDEDFPELRVPVRLVSPITETTPIYRTNDADGRPIYSLEVEFRGTTTFDQIPNRLRGGLYSTGEDEISVTVERWGEVVIADEGPLTVSFRGADYDLETVTYGPTDLVATLLRPAPGDEDRAVVIDFLDTFKKPGESVAYDS